MTIVKDQKKGEFFFSEHGSKQLHVRSKLSHTDVFILLKKGLYVPVGQDKHRIHVVIYSVVDNLPFVVVYDERNKEIITVLYVEYNNNFVISPTVLDEIREKTVKHDNESWDKRTQWIDLFQNLKHKEVFENVDLCFNVLKNDVIEKLHFYTIQANYISNNIKNINNIPNLKKLIEKARNRLKIDVTTIAHISADISLGRSMKVAAPRHSAIQHATHKQKQIKDALENNFDWICFMTQMRTNKVIEPVHFFVAFDTEDGLKEHHFHTVHQDDIQNNFNQIVKIPDLRNMLLTTCKELNLTPFVVKAFYAKSGCFKPVKFAESRSYGRQTKEATTHTVTEPLMDVS